MTLGTFNLAFLLSAKERQKARALVDSAVLKREGRTLFLLARPSTGLAAQLISLGVGTAAVIWLMPSAWRLASSDPANFWSPSSYLTWGVTGFLLWLVGRDLCRLLSGRWHAAYRGERGREGVHWGRQRLTADAERLTVELAARRSVYRWSAITEVWRTRDLLLLMLTPRTMIPIPRHAFEDEAEEEAFCTFVEERIGRTA